MPEVLKLTPEKGAVVPINEDPTDGGRTYDYTPGYLGQQVVNVATGSVYVATGVTPSNWLLTGSGSGSVPGVQTFDFAFDAADLANGVPFYTPTADDVAAGLWLLNAWLEIDTAWDGTTPLGDIGSSGATAGLIGAGTTGTPDLTNADAVGGYYGGNNLLLALNGKASLVAVTNAGGRVAPAKFTTTDPLLVWVTQDGTLGGADPGSTQGAGRVCYQIGKAA